MKSCMLAWALFLSASGLVDAESATPDAQAKFLAGFPVPGTPLEPLMGEASWQQHTLIFQKAWRELDRKQMTTIAEWMPRTAPYAYEDPATLFYFFSGPDFLYSHAFFPKAETTIMCGIEPVGDLPDMADMSGGSRAESLRNLRNSLDAILSFSFFRTIAMKTDFRSTELNGTLPVLYVFLAHANCRITGVEKVWLDPGGELHTEANKTPGVRVSYTTPEGKAQTVYYFCSDLSNEGIRNNPGFMAFCEKQGPGNALVKAASYLMHMDGFSKSREFLLTRARTLIQDDSGIPYHDLKEAGWSVALAGHYETPISLFKERYQADLREAFKSQPTVELPFSVGYRWRLNESSLMLARGPQTPVAPAAPRVIAQAQVTPPPPAVLKAIPVPEPPAAPVLTAEPVHE